RVEEVDVSQNGEALKKTINAWHNIAKQRYEAIGIIDWEDKEKIIPAQTSIRIIAEMKKRLNTLGDSSIYAVYDSSDTIQAIAIAKVKPEKAELECLATHPKNVALFKGEKSRTEGDRALLTRIVGDVKKTSKEALGLYAEPSTVNFYTDFGFRVCEDVAKKRTMPYLTLGRKSVPKPVPQEEASSSSDAASSIRVEKVTSRQTTALVKKIASSWYTLAQKRYEAVFSTDWKNIERLTLADTSKRVIYEIAKQFKNIGDRSIYVAYDEKNSIQGLALAKIAPEDSELECLATHPKNIPLFEREERCRGVGIALLAQVVRDAFARSTKAVGLYAEPTAVSFYTKYGFTVQSDVAKKGTMPFLTLEHKDRKKLLS
ncbi:MAG: GNAT family N-acetyltransferase, partial [Verrucomicrobia bacterium]|nr:GNAT family N-acetyltransferase [Verrucomicrobiota bacterium]